MLKCLKRILILAYFQTSLLMSKSTHCKHCKTIQIFNENMANMDKTLRYESKNCLRQFKMPDSLDM